MMNYMWAAAFVVLNALAFQQGGCVYLCGPFPVGPFTGMNFGNVPPPPFSFPGTFMASGMMTINVAATPTAINMIEVVDTAGNSKQVGMTLPPTAIMTPPPIISVGGTFNAFSHLVRLTLIDSTGVTTNFGSTAPHNFKCTPPPTFPVMSLSHFNAFYDPVFINNLQVVFI